jgi:hypothetical protein
VTSIFDDSFVGATYSGSAPYKEINSVYHWKGIWSGSVTSNMVDPATGTVANPGNINVKHRYLDDVFYSVDHAPFTWADVDTVTFVVYVERAYISEVFIGLIKDTSNPNTCARIGWKIVQNADKYLTTGTWHAHGCDGTPGNAWSNGSWTTTLADGFHSLRIRRISATSAAWSVDGGAESAYTAALPDDSDVLIPAMAQSSYTVAIYKEFLVFDRVTVTKKV